jgi:hypothetical protein
MTEDFWDNVKRNKIDIAISIYSEKIDYVAIISYARRKGVRINTQYEPGTKLEKLWWKYPIDIEGRQNASISYENCNLGRDCAQLKDGKLYACARIANIEYFNKHFCLNLEVMEKDYIDIYKTSNMKQIWNFLCSPVPFCKYCINESKDKSALFMNWGISKKELSEWV